MSVIKLKSSFISALSLGVFALSAFLFVDQPIHAETYVEGQHYKLVRQPSENSNPNKIKVEEFFWYGCPHCYKLEGVITPWKKTLGDDVEFVQVPGMAAPHWALMGRGFYAAESLGVAEKSHGALFNALHKDRKNIVNKEQLARFYSQFGVTEKAFLDQFESFSAKTSERKAVALFRQYGLTGVPAVIVNGKYQPISRNYDEMLKITNFLIEKERKEMLKGK